MRSQDVPASSKHDVGSRVMLSQLVSSLFIHGSRDGLADIGLKQFLIQKMENGLPDLLHIQDLEGLVLNFDRAGVMGLSS